MTADDVVASLERWGQLGGGGRETFKSVKHVTKVDAFTILIDLIRIFTPLIANIGDPKQAAIIVPKALARGGRGEAGQGVHRHGAVRVSEVEPGRQIVLARNARYASRAEDWGGITGKKVADDIGWHRDGFGEARW